VNRPAWQGCNKHLTRDREPANGLADTCPCKFRICWQTYFSGFSLRGPFDRNAILAKPELGSKRACLSCGTKFYDLNRNPILCPKCGTPFQAAFVPRARAEPDGDDDEAEAIEPAAAEFVPSRLSTPKIRRRSISATRSRSRTRPSERMMIPSSSLEEDEDEGDVADLIDGDLEDDEES